MKKLILLTVLLLSATLYSAEYEVKYNPDNGKPICVFHKDKGFIPIVSGNTDFKEFLEWNAKQQTPLDYTTPRVKPQAEIDAEVARKTRIEQARAILKALKAKPKEERTAEDVRNAVHAIIEILGEE